MRLTALDRNYLKVVAMASLIDRRACFLVLFSYAASGADRLAEIELQNRLDVTT